MISYIVVEDEPLIRKGIIKKIGQVDYPLQLLGEAIDGIEALELIEKLRPQLVFTDMRMPTMDGTLLLDNIVKLFPEVLVIVISGYSGFQYTRSAISSGVIGYLLKPFNVQELQEVIKKAAARLEINFSQKTEREKLAILQDRQTACAFLLGRKVCVPAFQSECFNVNIHRKDLQLLLLSQIALMENIESALFEYCWFPASENNSNIALLVSGSEEYCSLKLRLEQIWGNAFLVGISEPFQDIEKLCQAYAQCVKSLNEAPIVPSERFFPFSATKDNPNISLWDKFNLLMFSIEAGRENQTYELTTELFKYFLSLPKATIGQVKHYVTFIYNEIRTLLHNYLGIEGVSNTHFHLDMLFDIESIQVSSMTAFTRASTALAPYKTFASGDVIEDIIAYINRNYRKDLSLEFISSLFYLNSSYVSTLFKKNTGYNYVDYIAHVRIEKAKELLLSQNLKTGQISKRVGIENEKYFFRLFKKQTGMTPGEFCVKGK